MKYSLRNQINILLTNLITESKFSHALHSRDKDIELIDKIAIEFFGTEDDPNQVQVNDETYEKIFSLTNKWLGIQKTDDGDVMGWCAAFPTSLELMQKFLSHEINEKQLLDLTNPGDNGAIYVMSIFILPEYRGKVNPKSLAMNTIMPMREPDTQIFYHGFSPEGQRLGKLMGGKTFEK